MTPTGGWRISGGMPVGSAGDGFDFGPFGAVGTGTAPVEVVVGRRLGRGDRDLRIADEDLRSGGEAAVLGRQADVERGDVAPVRAFRRSRALREHDRVAPGAEVDARVRPDRGGLAVHDERAHARAVEVTGRARRARPGLRRAANCRRGDLTLEERERRHLRRGVRRRELAGARRRRGDRAAPGDDVHARKGARVPEGDGVDRRSHDRRRRARAAGHEHLQRKCLRGRAAVPRRGLRPGDPRGQREREERQCNREPLPHRAIDSGTGIYRPPGPARVGSLANENRSHYAPPWPSSSFPPTSA